MRVVDVDEITARRDALARDRAAKALARADAADAFAEGEGTAEELQAAEIALAAATSALTSLDDRVQRAGPPVMTLA